MTDPSTNQSIKDDPTIPPVAHANDRVPLSKLLGLARPERGMLILSVVLMLASEAGGLLIPLILAQAYDDLVNPNFSSAQRMSHINRTMLLVIVIHFSCLAVDFLRRACMGVIGERVVARTRNQLYGSILKQEIAFFDEHKTGELVSRLGSDTTLLQKASSEALPEVIIGGTTVLVSLVIMFWISPKLAGLMMGFVVLIGLICIPFGSLLGKLSKAHQDALGLAQTFSTEALGAMRTVQSFAAEDRERLRYSNVIGRPEKYPWWWPYDRKTQRTTYSVGFFQAITVVGMYMVIFGLGFGSMYISLWYGFKLVSDGEITLGKLTAFQSYIFQIGASLGQTSQFISNLIEAQGAGARVFFLLERKPAIPTTPESHPLPVDKKDNNDDESPARPQVPTSMVGAVDFNGVHFSYPSRPNVEVLTDFNLSIHANQTTALVGTSGSGKSTVVALLQRFYDVTSGSVMIDGHDIRDLDLKWLRSHIAYVQQEPQLFGLTVRENITFGMDREVTQEEVESATVKANAHEFISKWPDGYNTLVGERGIQLSGGQKQRLAISRALLVDPKILILDEATSSLDSESEYLVQEAINKAIVGRTVLIVAHRLSTIQRAHQIVVVDNHQIIDIGTHEVLLQRCTKYQDLIKRQSLMGELPSGMMTAS
jgi:ABC-type multidrug transport system fused ATPase/permease subunit